MLSLNDDSIGVVFNDTTKLLLLADGHNIHYIDYEGKMNIFLLNIIFSFAFYVDGEMRICDRYFIFHVKGLVRHESMQFYFFYGALYNI